MDDQPQSIIEHDIMMFFQETRGMRDGGERGSGGRVEANGKGMKVMRDEVALTILV